MDRSVETLENVTQRSVPLFRKDKRKITRPSQNRVTLIKFVQVIVATDIKKHAGVPDTRRVCANENCRVSCAKNREGNRGPRVLHQHADAVQCMEHKSEINRMFIEQLFAAVISASTVASTSLTRYRLRLSPCEVLFVRFTTKRDTCRMYRRLRRNGHTRAADYVALRGQPRVFFTDPPRSIKSVYRETLQVTFSNFAFPTLVLELPIICRIDQSALVQIICSNSCKNLEGACRSFNDFGIGIR